MGCVQTRQDHVSVEHLQSWLATSQLKAPGDMVLFHAMGAGNNGYQNLTAKSSYMRRARCSYIELMGDIGRHILLEFLLGP